MRPSLPPRSSIRPLACARANPALAAPADYCLAHLLRGIILRFISHPEPHVVARPEESPIPIDEADEQALISFKCVVSRFSSGSRSAADALSLSQQRPQARPRHLARPPRRLVRPCVFPPSLSLLSPSLLPLLLLSFLHSLSCPPDPTPSRADYELGRLYQSKGDWALAREQYELVMSGKHLEVNTAKKGKGKVSLQVRPRRLALCAWISPRAGADERSRHAEHGRLALERRPADAQGAGSLSVESSNGPPSSRLLLAPAGLEGPSVVQHFFLSPLSTSILELVHLSVPLVALLQSVANLVYPDLNVDGARERSTWRIDLGRPL